ncbi:FAD-dependent oxidoreductase [uncultured Paracoccus sp.]|uniref:FAD-dependent oxidoreductase n=1 Tax=Paracoccus sp. M683 TaxID=2594268 RepID=UPI0034365D19
MVGVASALALQARGHSVTLVKQAGATALVHRDGYFHLFQDPRKFEAAIAEAERRAATFGVRSWILDGAQTMAAEPALTNRPAGAVHRTDSWTVTDPGGLTKAYAALFQARGGGILIGDALSLVPAAGGQARLSCTFRCPSRSGPSDAACRTWRRSVTHDMRRAPDDRRRTCQAPGSA